MTHSSFHNSPSFKKDKTGKKPPMSPGLKFLLEMGPLALYFMAYFRGSWLIEHVSLFADFKDPIFPATAIFMVAAVIALVLSLVISRTILVMPLISGLVIILFGSLSLWFQNDIFAKIKPTIINSLFSIILFAGVLLKKPLLKFVFGAAFNLDEAGWHKLSFRWACFFLVLALLNEAVWRSFSTDIWMTFRTIVPLVLSIVFILTQMPLIMRHSLDNK